MWLINGWKNGYIHELEHNWIDNRVHGKIGTLWKSLQMNKYTNEWVDKWMSWQMNECTNEWVHKWMITQMNEYTNEWVH
jgi:hypothetical protein